MTEHPNVAVLMRLDLTAWEGAMFRLAEALNECAPTFEALHEILATPRRSAMRAAYRAKTRRRNRR